jgi:cytochrome c553
MKRTMHILLAITVTLLGSASALAQGTAPTRAIQEEERAALFPSAHMIEMGRDVAGTECSACHGLDGIGIAKDRPKLAGQRAIYLYRMLQSYQHNGRENESMRHVSSFLNDQAMLSVAAYYANLPPAPNVPLDTAAADAEPLDVDPFTAIRDAVRKCSKCHGETGNSTTPGMPSLTAQDPEYFLTSMQAYVDGNRDHKLMKRLAGKLDEETVKEMSIFYAVQQPMSTAGAGEGDAETGRGLAEECAACHGSDGNANGKNMPTLAGQDARYFVKAMNAYKTDQRQHESMLEAANKLSEEDFGNLAAFYAVQKPVKRNVPVPLKTTEWITRCDRCHGSDGNSTDPRFPMLAGQNAPYLRSVMQAYAGGNRSTTIMHKMSEPLSEADIERIVSHYASREPRSILYVQIPCEEAVD